MFKLNQVHVQCHNSVSVMYKCHLTNLLVAETNDCYKCWCKCLSYHATTLFIPLFCYIVIAARFTCSLVCLYIYSNHSNCLVTLDNDQVDSETASDVKLWYGQLYDLDEQCRYKLGKDSYFCRVAIYSAGLYNWYICVMPSNYMD